MLKVIGGQLFKDSALQTFKLPAPHVQGDVRHCDQEGHEGREVVRGDQVKKWRMRTGRPRVFVRSSEARMYVISSKGGEVRVFDIMQVAQG